MMDIKEAAPPAAPRSSRAKIPTNPAERVVEGARHLSPYLGTRMRASKLMHKPVFVRELMPQDLKIEIERLSPDEATKTAYFLSAVVGKAHSRQMDSDTRAKWLEGSSTQSLEVFGRAVLALDKCSRPACGSRESLSRTLPKILIGEGSGLVSRPPKK